MRKESKLKELGFDRWIDINENGQIIPSKVFTGKILVGELEPNTYRDNVNKAKGVISQFMEKMKSL